MEDEEELSSSLSLLLSLSSEEELEESLLSDDESLEEPSESLLLSLESFAFFLIFFSLEPSLPGPVMLRGLFSFSLSFFFNSTVLDGLCTYFRFPVHS